MGSDCVAQGFIQLGLEILRGWRLHNFSEQSVLMLDCPHGEKVFLGIQSGTTSLISIHACYLLLFCHGLLRTFSSPEYRSPASPHGACAVAL